MADKQTEEKEEKTKIRHTITAEETFTLAKDVFDIRTFLKNVYANRAVIARRIHIVTLVVSFIFTVLYSAFIVFSGLTKRLSLGADITLYVLLGLYGVMAITLVIVGICGSHAKTKDVRKFSNALKFFRLAVRILSLAVSLAAIIFAVSDGKDGASSLAVQILVISFSIITFIVQLLPLLFGGTGKFVRWLLSPVKVKRRFAAVILEWYELIVTGSAQDGPAKKVSKKYFDEIGILIDNYLVPELGKKYITAIKPANLLTLVENCDDEQKPILEGLLKNVFAYAADCGYVVFDPCRDLNFEGSVEEEEKKKKTMKDRFLNVGKRIGKSMLDKYIVASSTDDDDD